MTLSNRCGPDWLHDKIAAGKTVIIDGAMGTELESRGVPMDAKAWSGAALLTHPDVVRAAHADYIMAGAEVIIANTFAAGRQLLQPAGLADELERINRSAVEMARQARDAVATGPVAIAGSMCEWAGGEMAEMGRLTDAFTEQAELLADEEVDLIVLEMCSHPKRSALIVEVALATGLPVWLGLSCRKDAESGRLVGYDPPHTDFDSLVAELSGAGVGLINIMHTSIGDTSAGNSAVQRHWPGPLGAYPESGYFAMPNWQFVDIIEPADLVNETRTWIESGAQIVGGCCGLSVSHIKALKAEFG